MRSLVGGVGTGLMSPMSGVGEGRPRGPAERPAQPDTYGDGQRADAGMGDEASGRPGSPSRLTLGRSAYAVKGILVRSGAVRRNQSGERGQEPGSRHHRAESGRPSGRVRLEIGVWAEQDQPTAAAGNQRIGPVRTARRPVDEDEVELGRKLVGSVDPDDVGAGSFGHRCDPTEQEEIADDGADPHAPMGSSVSGSVASADGSR